MLALPPLFVVKMSDVCSLDVLETARVAFGFGEAIWESLSARKFLAAGTVCSSLQEGSSMRLIAPLMQAEERWTMKE